MSQINELITKEQLFLQYAPQFNFELDAEQLVAKGLELGFISQVAENSYQINDTYGEA